MRALLSNRGAAHQQAKEKADLFIVLIYNDKLLYENVFTLRREFAPQQDIVASQDQKTHAENWVVRKFSLDKRPVTLQICRPAFGPALALTGAGRPL